MKDLSVQRFLESIPHYMDGSCPRAPATRKNIDLTIRRLRLLGTLKIGEVTQDHISAIADTLTPGARTVFLNTTAAIFREAVDLRWIAHNPARGIKKARSRGLRPMTDVEYEIVRDGAMQPVRLAAIIGRNTGQRISDVLKMDWSDLRTIDGLWAVHIQQQKTGSELMIPLNEELTAELMRIGQKASGPIVENARGYAYNTIAFAKLWRKECDRLGLPKDTVFHGLRKLAAIRVAERGGSTKEIMALGGWKSPRVAMGYVEQAEQFRLAQNAVEKL